MRLKDPFSLKTAEMTKRSNKPKKPHDEDSSDEVSGKESFQYHFSCQNIIHGMLSWYSLKKIIEKHPRYLSVIMNLSCMKFIPIVGLPMLA